MIPLASAPAQGGGLPPQGQVDHPRFPLIQYGAQEDGFSLGHGGEGNPVPAVQVFEGSVGEVEEGHGTVLVQALGDELPALVQGGPGLPLGGISSTCPGDGIPGTGRRSGSPAPGSPAYPAPGTGGDVGPEGLHVAEKARLGPGRRRYHGAEPGAGLGQIGQQSGGGGGPAACPALPEVPVPFLVPALVSLPLGAGDGQPVPDVSSCGA